MTSSEDVLLKEVDEDLNQERQLNFLKTYGPWLGGAAALLVIGVGASQVMEARTAAAQAQSAEAYAMALTENAENPALAADALDQLAGQLDGGYAALAHLREATLRLATGETDIAAEKLRSVYDDASLPARLRDYARIRAAFMLAETDPPAAAELAEAVTTPAFSDYATEIKAIVAMAGGSYEEAYGLYSALATDSTNPALVARAQTLMPVADAGRRGVTLAPEKSEADAFLDSFTDQLESEGIVPARDETTP